MTGLERRSFHDPDGSVYLSSERVLRALVPAAAERVERFAASPLARELQSEGVIVDLSAIAPAAADGRRWFEHRRLPFVGYPHEWTPERVLAACDATLALAQRLRVGGWDLKDGNLRNIVFEGSRPVFVDWGSFVERDDRSPVWRAAGQLQRQALLPLLLHRHLDWPVHELLLARPDGVDPERAQRALGAWTALRDPAVLWNASLPAWLSRRSRSLTTSAPRPEPEVARRSADLTIAGLRRSVARFRARLRPPASDWAAYAETREHYQSAELSGKREHVNRLLAALRPAAVLDVGANGGEFSAAAAAHAQLVVSVDNDVDALRVAQRVCARFERSVHHLLVDISAPTPALGWNAAECASFESRSRGRFDLVMALAVLHHLTVDAGIPLDEVVAWMARMTRRHLLVEFVYPTDPRFIQIAAPRARDGRGLQRDDFEQALAASFEVRERIELVAGRRWLYHAELR